MHRFPAATSFGDSHPGFRRQVREFNPCHDPASGKFCSEQGQVAMLDAMPKLKRVSTPRETRFITSDGTRFGIVDLNHPHDKATGWQLTEVLNSGVARYLPYVGVEVRSLTPKQARIIADDFIEYGDSVVVDVVNEDRELVASKEFFDPSEDVIYSFVNAKRVREANPCHDDASGRFTFKGRGRCLGLPARMAARRDYEQKYGKWGPDLRYEDARFDTGLLGQPRDYDRIAADNDEKLLHGRKEFRKFTRSNRIPHYLKKDEQESRRVDSTVTMHDPAAHTDLTRATGAAAMASRRVHLEPYQGMPVEDQVSVARHEYGHIDRTPLGRGGMRIGKLEVSPQIAEEIRAWKNAIRNSGGDVSQQYMADALSTYMREHPMVQRETERRQLALHEERDNYTRTEWNDLMDKVSVDESRRAVKVHIMPAMRRYIRRVQRAAKES